MRFVNGLLGMVIGAVPGVILVLIAQFVIKGEWQLTIGAPGLVLAGVGAIVGFILGASRRPAARGGTGTA
jgi:hypothetical protein